ALATGVGMVRFLGPKAIRKPLIQYRPAVVLANGPVDALLIGCGVKTNIFHKTKLAKLNKLHIPKVLDAGAIYLANSINSPTVITPHLGELAKFLGIKSAEIEENPLHFAQITAEKTGATVLLKGNRTLVVNKKRAIQLPQATTWLATAGTGDVLAGILGALIAINKISDENLVEVSATASLIHALAAESASPASIDIEALIKEIPEIISRN
ncbi:MAG: ADP-dependent NAD(P)H-hydrate dehydratase, partial [Candidatus Nanopelagicaceae bacterium]